MTNRKSHTGFQLVPKLVIFNAVIITSNFSSKSDRYEGSMWVLLATSNFSMCEKNKNVYIVYCYRGYLYIILAETFLQ